MNRTLAAVTLAVGMVISLVLAVPSAAVHNGGTGLEDADRAGCHCHNIEADPGVTLNLMGLPEGYDPDQVYELIVTVAGGPPMDEGTLNAGGFMVSCTNGTFAVPPGSDLVQVFNEGRSASHTMAGNDHRQWTVLWKAPKEGSGDAVFYLAANTVNGDGVETGELDAYNLLRTISMGTPQAVDPEDEVSEWGVPLRAYWMGSIAFVATLALTWMAFYLIKGTSRHHTIHIGSRRRYLVEERTPPSSFGSAFILTVLAIVEVGAAVVLFHGLYQGGGEVGLAINLGVVLGLFFVILAIYRSTFVPKLTSIKPESPGPGEGG
jgi:hypothetical protein